MIEELGQHVRALDPACLSGADASTLMGLFARGEKLCAPAKALLAARAVEAREWSWDGARSAEEWLAGRWGTSQASAKAGLKAGKMLEKASYQDFCG